MSEHDYLTCSCSRCAIKRVDKGDWGIRRELMAKIDKLEAEKKLAESYISSQYDRESYEYEIGKLNKEGK